MRQVLYANFMDDKGREVNDRRERIVYGEKQIDLIIDYDANVQFICFYDSPRQGTGKCVYHNRFHEGVSFVRAGSVVHVHYSANMWKETSKMLGSKQ